MKKLIDVSKTKSMRELRRYRGRKLNARDAFQLPRTLRTLVWQDALKFERDGQPRLSASLYYCVSQELKAIAQNVPPIYRPLIESSSQFWEIEASKVKATNTDENLRTKTLSCPNIRVKRRLSHTITAPIKKPLRLLKSGTASKSRRKPNFVQQIEVNSNEA